MIFYDCSNPKYPSAVNENNLESGCIKASAVGATKYIASLVWKQNTQSKQNQPPHTTQEYDNLLLDFQKKACQG